MISLSLVQYLPFWFSDTEIKKREPHKSGFGTEITDIDGCKRHVKESMKEIEDKLKSTSKNVSLGNPASPRKIQIEIPNNVPSRVKPIVIFPTVEANKIVVTVTEYDGNGVKMVNTTVNPELSHVINLNTGVE